jgi:hypothetical protein
VKSFLSHWPALLVLCARADNLTTRTDRQTSLLCFSSERELPLFHHRLIMSCAQLYITLFFFHRLMGAFACTARFASRGRTGLVFLDASVFACRASERPTATGHRNGFTSESAGPLCSLNKKKALFRRVQYSGICPAGCPGNVPSTCRCS